MRGEVSCLRCTLTLTAGFAVVTYDKSFEGLSALVDDVDSSELLIRVAAAAMARLGDGGGAGPYFLAGHSRGAKVGQGRLHKRLGYSGCRWRSFGAEFCTWRDVSEVG